MPRNRASKQRDAQHTSVPPAPDATTFFFEVGPPHMSTTDDPITDAHAEKEIERDTLVHGTRISRRALYYVHTIATACLLAFIVRVSVIVGLPIFIAWICMTLTARYPLPWLGGFYVYCLSAGLLAFIVRVSVTVGLPIFIAWICVTLFARYPLPWLGGLYVYCISAGLLAFLVKVWHPGGEDSSTNRWIYFRELLGDRIFLRYILTAFIWFYFYIIPLVVVYFFEEATHFFGQAKRSSGSQQQDESNSDTAKPKVYSIGRSLRWRHVHHILHITVLSTVVVIWCCTNGGGNNENAFHCFRLVLVLSKNIAKRCPVLLRKTSRNGATFYLEHSRSFYG